MSQESSDSREPSFCFQAGDVRRRLSDSFHEITNKPFAHDPQDPSAEKLKQPWQVSYQWKRVTSHFLRCIISGKRKAYSRRITLRSSLQLEVIVSYSEMW